MPGIFNMTNLNAQEKSRGVVLFAFNTDQIDYEKIANQSAKLIRHVLKLPVTIVTDIGDIPRNYRTGYLHGTQWYNSGRYHAYELSPYDETLLLDSDYLILDDSLLKILDTIDDYAVMTTNQNPQGSMNGDMGILSLNFVWATAVAFKKTQKSKLLFDLVGRIQRNYGYYRKLYNLREQNFRNDYAFAIADNILNGYTNSQGIPWQMLTFDKSINRIDIKNNYLIVREQESAQIIPIQNIHIMDKNYLLSTQHDEFIEHVCQN